MELESHDPLNMDEDGANGEEKRALMSEKEVDNLDKILN